MAKLLGHMVIYFFIVMGILHNVNDFKGRKNNKVIFPMLKLNNFIISVSQLNQISIQL